METATILTEEEIKLARNWLKDCPWQGMDADDFDKLTTKKIELGIKRFYDGGIETFRAESKYY